MLINNRPVRGVQAAHYGTGDASNQCSEFRTDGTSLRILTIRSRGSGNDGSEKRAGQSATHCTFARVF